MTRRCERSPLAMRRRSAGQADMPPVVVAGPPAAPAEPWAQKAPEARAPAPSGNPPSFFINALKRSNLSVGINGPWPAYSVASVRSSDVSGFSRGSPCRGVVAAKANSAASLRGRLVRMAVKSMKRLSCQAALLRAALSVPQIQPPPMMRLPV